MKTFTSYICLLIMALCLTVNVQAQDNIIKSLESFSPGQGRVKVYQDPQIEALLGSANRSRYSEDGIIKSSGYRVQVYAGGNSRDAKNQAESIAARVKSAFPELRVYTMFNPPRWLCRVGDFLSYEEADAMKRKLIREGGFREAAIVKEQISIPY